MSLPIANRLVWRIHFQDSLNVNNVTAVFIPSDSVGHVIMNQHMFVFNLTSSSHFRLESTLTVNISSNIMSFNGASVSCSKGVGTINQAVIHILNGNISSNNIT